MFSLTKLVKSDLMGSRMGSILSSRASRSKVWMRSLSEATLLNRFSLKMNLLAAELLSLDFTLNELCLNVVNWGFSLGAGLNFPVRLSSSLVRRSNTRGTTFEFKATLLGSIGSVPGNVPTWLLVGFCITPWNRGDANGTSVLFCGTGRLKVGTLGAGYLPPFTAPRPPVVGPVGLLALYAARPSLPRSVLERLLKNRACRLLFWGGPDKREPTTALALLTLFSPFDLLDEPLPLAALLLDLEVFLVGSLTTDVFFEDVLLLMLLWLTEGTGTLCLFWGGGGEASLRGILLRGNGTGFLRSMLRLESSVPLLALFGNMRPSVFW